MDTTRRLSRRAVRADRREIKLIPFRPGRQSRVGRGTGNWGRFGRAGAAAGAGVSVALAGKDPIDLDLVYEQTDLEGQVDPHVAGRYRPGSRSGQCIRDSPGSRPFGGSRSRGVYDIPHCPVLAVFRQTGRDVYRWHYAHGRVVEHADGYAVDCLYPAKVYNDVHRLALRDMVTAPRRAQV